MGCFDSNTSTKSGGAKVSNERSYEDKKYEWFLSSVGLEVYDEYIQQKNFDNDKIYKKEAEEKNVEYYSVYVNVYRKGFKSPNLFLRQLVSSLGEVEGCSPALKYVGPIDILTGALEAMLEPYFTDDNGDLIPRNIPLTKEQVVDYNKNPLLKFAKEFKVIDFEDDGLDFKAACDLWFEAVWFIWSEIVVESRVDVLENNPWLFEKDTYLNAAGGLRKEKGFFTTGKEKSTNPKYFEDELAKAN